MDELNYDQIQRSLQERVDRQKLRTQEEENTITFLINAFNRLLSDRNALIEKEKERQENDKNDIEWILEGVEKIKTLEQQVADLTQERDNLISALNDTLVDYEELKGSGDALVWQIDSLSRDLADKEGMLQAGMFISKALLNQPKKDLSFLHEQMLKVERAYRRVVLEMATLKPRQLDKLEGLVAFEWELGILGEMLGLKDAEVHQIEEEVVLN